MAKQMDVDWQKATLETIGRLRQVLALPSAPQDRLTRVDLYNQARMITQAMGVSGARFWNVFINVLRILLAAESKEPIRRGDLFD